MDNVVNMDKLMMFILLHRVLDEKREAFDTIELLKLIGRHQGFGKQGSTEHRPFSPSSSTTSLSTMSSFSSNNQQ